MDNSINKNLINKIIYFQKPNYLKLRDYLCVDMHFHTTYSDGASTITQVFEKINKLNLSVSITDHNEINGSLELKKVLDKKKSKKINNPIVIPGIEVKSDELIDILFYFYTYKELIKFYNIEIKPNKIKFLHTTKTKIPLINLYNLSKKYKTIAVVAHPYGYTLRGGKNLFKKYEKLIKEFNTIEILNGGNSRKQNLMALKLLKNKTQKNNKSFTGGSDGHSIYSLGKILTCAKAKNIKDFLNSIKNKKNFIIGEEPFLGKYSEYIKYGTNKLRNLIKNKN